MGDGRDLTMKELCREQNPARRIVHGACIRLAKLVLPKYPQLAGLPPIRLMIDGNPAKQELGAVPKALVETVLSVIKRRLSFQKQDCLAL